LTIWVADTDNNRVSVWSRPTIDTQTWSALSTFGTEGIGADDFNDPVQARVTADSGILWVVDHLNDRISVWTQSCPAQAAATPHTMVPSSWSG
jgi:DNA-binding beta-propeller fold protein YncE